MKKSAKALALLTFLLSATPAFAAEAAAAAPAHGGKQSYLAIFKEGGWVMWPLLVCSICLVWLVIDIWMRTSKPKMVPDDELLAAQSTFRTGDYVGSYQAMKAYISPFASVMRMALSSVGTGKNAVEESIFIGVEKTNSALQTRINYLSVIGVCTPMIGLLGTVFGMRGAFAELGNSGVSDPSALSKHIGEVLVATASGLLVAIPAFMAFYFLKNRLQIAVHYLEEEVNTLFRNAPYDYLAGADVGQEEVFAALPNWVEVPAE